MKNKSNKHLKTSMRKYSMKMASLFLSTLLLMNSVPVISAVAEDQTEDVEAVENTENGEEETESEEIEEVEGPEEESVEDAPEIAPAAATAVGEEENSSGTMADELSDDSEDMNDSDDADEDSDENQIVEVNEEIREREIPFEVEHVNDPTLPEGDEVISQEGVDGVLELTVEITTYEDGTFDEEIINEEILTEATPQIILVGTMVEEEPEEPAEPEEPEIPEAPAPPEDSEEQGEEEAAPPWLQVDPIFTNAETINGSANPNAQVVVFYPGSDRERSANVDSNGNWMIRNLAGDAEYLTEGSTVPMQLIYDEQIHEYEDQFYVQAESQTPDDYSAADEVVDVANNNSGGEDNTSTENLSSSSTSGNPESTESAETLPETGESVNGSTLGVISLAAGLGLMVVGKKKETN